MTAMTTGSVTPLAGLPRGRALTRDDLDAMPEDGYRYELIDGILVVSPAPLSVHQRAVRKLMRLLDDACPIELELFSAPFDVAIANDTVMQPDLVIVRSDDLKVRGVETAPVLAIEILSPSTRGLDLLLKKDRLQRAGCQHYWVIDTDVPAITVWSLRDGVYVDSGSATGEEMLTLDKPFTVSVVPAQLIVR